MRVVCLLFRETAAEGQCIRDLLPKIAEAVYRYSPQVALAREAVFLEIEKCRGLYREDSLLARLERVTNRFGVSPMISIAPDLPTALASARYRQKKRGLLPIEALEDYLDPFRKEDVLFKMIESLKRLGVQTLEQFEALPQGEVTSRFGKLSFLVRERLKRPSQIPWPHFSLPERLFERRVFYSDEGIEGLDALVFVLKGLVDRLCLRMRGRSEKIAALGLVFRMEAYSTLKSPERKWVFHFPIPQIRSHGILDLLRERLDFDFSQEPLGAPVLEVELEVKESAPGGGAQRDFFQKKEEEREEWESLVMRLTQKLGLPCVFLASLQERYLPEKGWERCLDLKQKTTEEVSATLPLPERPLRLLKQPVPLIRYGRSLTYGALRWRVKEWDGPEVLSGEWWDEEYHREYYRVSTLEGEELWLFRKTGETRTYLHGFFD